MSVLLQWLMFYIRFGLALARAGTRSKAPLSRDWTKQADPPDSFADDDNVVVVLGQSRLVAVDFDGEDSYRFAAIAPPSEWTYGRTSKPVSQMFFCVDGSPKSRTWKGLDGRVLVELRCGPQASLVPPSIHPSGEALTWTRSITALPPRYAWEALVARCAAIAIGTVLLPFYPCESSRHAFHLALSGWLLRLGMQREVVSALAETLASTAGDPEVDDRRRCVDSTAQRLTDSLPVVEDVAAFIPAETRNLVARWLGRSKVEVSSVDRDEPPSIDLCGAIRASGATAIRSTTGCLFIVFASDDARSEVLPLDSGRAAARIRRIGRNALGRVPTSSKVEDALNSLRSDAEFAAPVQVHARFARTNDSIEIDLGDESFQRVVIRPASPGPSWELATTRTHFVRSATMRPLPTPARSPAATLLELGHFVNVGSSGDELLVLVWIVDVMIGLGPRTILVFRGGQGSAKTTSSRMIRGLIDPDEIDVESPPRSATDLMVRASSTVVLVIDNVSSLSPWTSDALCRLATGGAFTVRKLYTNDEVQLLKARVPIIMNGIDDPLARPDLADRSILIDAPSIPASQRRPEADLVAAFEEARPRILGALYSLVSLVLARLSGVSLTSAPRMADFARTGVAVERALGLPDGEFLRTYEANRHAVNSYALAVDPLADAVKKLVADHPTRSLSLPPTTLHQQLNRLVEDRGRLPSAWPASARALSDRLKRLAPVLAEDGIDIVHGKSGSRFIQLRDVRFRTEGDR